MPNIILNPFIELIFKVVCEKLYMIMWSELTWITFDILFSLGHFMGRILCDIYLCPFQSLWVILFTGQIQDQIFVVNNSSFIL